MRRTECLNGFWDGIEGGLGGAIWLLVGRHYGWMSGGILLRGFSAYAPVVLLSVCIDWTMVMVWYPRTVSLSRKVPNADVAGCSMVSNSFSSQIAIGCCWYIRVRRDIFQ